VGVREDQHVAIGTAHHTRQRCLIAIREEILVHPARAAVDEAEAPALRLEAKLRHQGTRKAFVYAVTL
jgi:hypothetical protein